MSASQLAPGSAATATSTSGELVLRARQGDDDAWRRLVERHTPLMWAVLRGVRLDHAARADLVQTAWVALAEHLGDLREPDAVGAWLASTVRRAAWREARRQGRVELRDDFSEREFVDPEPTPHDWVAGADRDERVRRAVAKLSVSDRRLLSLLMLSPPPSYREIAEALDVPMGSIGPTRARCLQRLRKHLWREGLRDASVVAV